MRKSLKFGTQLRQSLIQRIVTIAAIVLLVACSSTPKVNSDYDDNYAFENINSYYALPDNQSPLHGQPGSSLSDQRVTKALTSEMAARDITAKSSEEADIWVVFHIVSKDKTRVTSYNNMYGYHGYDYRYGSGSSVEVRQYTQGTLLIDLIDPASKKTVWRSTSSAIIKNRSPAEEQALISEHVATALQDIPGFKIVKEF